MGKQSWMVTSSEAIKTPHLVQRLVRINQLNFPSKSCQLEDTYTDLGAAWKKGEKEMEKLVFTLIRMQKKWSRCSVPHKDLLHVIWCHLAFLKGSMYKIYSHRSDPLIGSNWGHLSLAAMLKTIKKNSFLFEEKTQMGISDCTSHLPGMIIIDFHSSGSPFSNVLFHNVIIHKHSGSQPFPFTPPRPNTSLLLHMHKGNIRMSLGELFIHKKQVSPNFLFYTIILCQCIHKTTARALKQRS